MTDLASPPARAHGIARLPISWYFDPRIFELERKLLFGPGPGYVGHELMVPARGDYHTLEWTDHTRLLVRNDAGVELFTNACRHRQAVIVEGRGNAEHLVCPLHRWTYDLHGTLIGAPHFAENPCRNLFRTPLKRWNGMLFEGRRDVACDLAGLDGEFDFSGYVFDRMVVSECRQNWKTFVEIYLELYHVAPFHPGLAGFVDCDDLRWSTGERWSLQVVGLNEGLRRPGSAVYRDWHEQVLRYQRGRDPAHGAMWMLYAPNVMLEWYPNTIVVSTLVPRSPESTLNVIEFYYPEEIALFERDYVEAGQKAYLETAHEDEIIGQRTDRGRRALLEQGIEDFGPVHSPLEDGIVHFHDFVRRELDPHLERAA